MRFLAAAVLFVTLILSTAAPAWASGWQAFEGAPVGFDALTQKDTKPPRWSADADFSSQVDVPLSAVAIPLTTSPVAGTFGVQADDFYSIDLSYYPDEEIGDYIYASIDGAPGTDFDLYLYGPSTHSVQDIETQPPLTGNDWSEYPNGLVWQAQESGTYNFDVHVGDPGSTGDYSLVWYMGPGIDPFGTSTPYPKYRAYATLSGKFLASGNGGTGIPGEYMRLYAVRSDDSLRITNVTAETAADGTFEMKAAPLNKTTYVISVDQGVDPDLQPNIFSRSVTVTPKVYISTPYPTVGVSKVKAGRTYTWQALLRPRHIPNQSSVYLKTYRLINHKWVYYKTFWTKNSNVSSSTSRIRASVRLPYRGKWRILPVAQTDATHSKTAGPARYITVR